MRLLIVTQTNDRSEVALYTELHRAGVQVAMLCASGAPGCGELQEAGITVRNVRIRHRLDLEASGAVRALLNAEPFDVLYAPRNSGLAVSLRAARSVHTRVVGYRGTMGHLSRWDPAAWITYLHPRLSHIVCNCRAVRDYLLSMGIPDARLTVLYKGHDVAWYRPSPRVKLTEFGIPTDALAVGFAGNMRPVKGVDVLLRAMESLPPDRAIHLLLVGDVRDGRVHRLIAGSPARDRIHLAGYRADASALVGACDIFVMPSVDREGVPRAVVEAMAQGCSPIVTRVGGMPEIVADGTSGIVVPPRDPAALAGAITTMADDPEQRKRLGTAARLRVESGLTVGAAVETMLSICQRILDS